MIIPYSRFREAVLSYGIGSRNIQIYSAFDEFCTRLETPEGETLYDGFRERLLKIRRKTKGMECGFGDGIKLRVREIEDFFEEDVQDN
ncbi:hypothetical protein MSBRW_2067 [Methanosarcina barkeri str. Wiesmoor]|uniref:Uncharacterized protein n=2 Tax=Methanosarcina barkeri TaxID=2208 RepID=A0A0E3QKB1_METBA|nr:hypothetical protein MSBRW_2067 [Methanosarcina barkeri str. Wiesmoor]